MNSTSHVLSSTSTKHYSSLETLPFDLLEKRVNNLFCKAVGLTFDVGLDLGDFNLTMLYKKKGFEISIPQDSSSRSSSSASEADSESSMEDTLQRKKSVERSSYESHRDGFRELSAMVKTLEKVHNFVKSFELISEDQIFTLETKFESLVTAKDQKDALPLQFFTKNDEFQKWRGMLDTLVPALRTNLEGVVTKEKKEAKSHAAQTSAWLESWTSGDEKDISLREKDLSQKILEKDPSTKESGKSYSSSSMLYSREDLTFEFPRDIFTSLQNIEQSLVEESSNLKKKYTRLEIQTPLQEALKKIDNMSTKGNELAKSIKQQMSSRNRTKTEKSEKTLARAKKLVLFTQRLMANQKLSEEQLRLVDYLAPEEYKAIEKLSQSKVQIPDEVQKLLEPLQFTIEICDKFIAEIARHSESIPSQTTKETNTDDSEEKEAV